LTQLSSQLCNADITILYCIRQLFLYVLTSDAILEHIWERYIQTQWSDRQT